MHPLGSESHIKASQNPTFTSNQAFTEMLLKMFSGSPHFSIFNPIHLKHPGKTSFTELSSFFLLRWKSIKAKREKGPITPLNWISSVIHLRCGGLSYLFGECWNDISKGLTVFHDMCIQCHVTSSNLLQSVLADLSIEKPLPSGNLRTSC